MCHVDFLEQHCIRLEMSVPLTLHFSKCWCRSTDLGFAFLSHIAYFCIHVHNDQISYSNWHWIFYLSNLWPLGWLGFRLSTLPPTFVGLLPRPPLEELLPLPLKLFLPLPLPWLMDDCAANAPSNDACVLLSLSSWLQTIFWTMKCDQRRLLHEVVY